MYISSRTLSKPFPDGGIFSRNRVIALTEITIMLSSLTLSFFTADLQFLNPDFQKHTTNSVS